MKFIKDILILDFEGRKNPVQLGAILLDKETLEEKASFSSYIYADLNGYVSETSGIDQEALKGAPSQAEVGSAIFEKFGTDVLLSSWVQDLDITHFKNIMEAAGHSFGEYDYHVLDIWPIAYAYLLKKGYQGGIRSEEIFQYFGARKRGLHDALEDCRIEANILRKIILYNMNEGINMKNLKG